MGGVERSRGSLSRLGLLLVVASALVACGGQKDRSPGAQESALQSAAEPGQSPVQRSGSQSFESPQKLIPGEPVSVTLEPGGEAHFAVALAEDEAAVVVAGQQELDVAVEIFDPGGQRLIAFDSPVARQAPERVCWVAQRSGRYSVRLSPFGAVTGKVGLELLWKRQARDEDVACAVAERELMTTLERSEREPLTAGLLNGYRRAAEHGRAAGDPYLAGLALRELGVGLRKLGRSVEAAATLEQALSFAEAARSEYLAAGVLNRWGLALHDLGELSAAVAFFEEALDRSRAVGDRYNEGDALNNLGLAELGAGEPHRAVTRFLELLPVWRDLGESYRQTVALENLATAHGLLDHHDEALARLDEGLELALRYGHRDRQASLLVAEGWIHHLRGESVSGVPRLRRALELYRDLGYRGSETAVLDRLGTLLRATGSIESAREAYEASLAMSEADGSSWDAASTLANLGCLAQEAGEAARALDLLTRARKRFEGLDELKGRAHVDYCRALALRDQEAVPEAITAVEEALEVVDALRATARRSGNLYAPIWLWQDYAELQVELLLEGAERSGDVSLARRAFEASDVARARNLYELVLESEVGVRANANPELLRRERDAGAKLDQLQKQLRNLTGEDAENSGPRRRLEGELRRAIFEVESARAAIRIADPRYAELVDPRPVRVDQLQAELEGGTILLTYRLGETASHLFAVSRDHFTVHELPPGAEVELYAGRLYDNLRREAPRQIQLDLLASSLGEQVLPAEAIPQDVRRLLIVADGALHYVPFAVLRSPRATAEERRMLVEDFELAYLPSASVLAALRRRDGVRRSAAGEVAVFADPVFAEDDPRLESLRRAGSRLSEETASTRGPAVERLPQGNLPRLPWTAVEAGAILSRAPAGKALSALGFDASKGTLATAPLGNYRFLHFATHALIDERFPELSGVVLSRRDAGGRVVDGDLPLHEIYTLELNAELAVLSGCQTALGPEVRGDGLLSMTRGFLYTGASAVAVSLWPVHDEATSVLMDELYAGLLGRGESPAAALRAAQLAMARSGRWSQPYYWAAFVIEGDSR